MRQKRSLQSQSRLLWTFRLNFCISAWMSKRALLGSFKNSFLGRYAARRNKTPLGSVILILLSQRKVVKGEVLKFFTQLCSDGKSICLNFRKICFLSKCFTFTVNAIAWICSCTNCQSFLKQFLVFKNHTFNFLQLHQITTCIKRFKLNFTKIWSEKCKNRVNNGDRHFAHCNKVQMYLILIKIASFVK